MVGSCQQTFENKTFVDITQQCFAQLPQVDFPDNNLNFHWKWRWWDEIQAIFLKLFYFMCIFCYQLLAMGFLELRVASNIIEIQLAKKCLNNCFGKNGSCPNCNLWHILIIGDVKYRRTINQSKIIYVPTSKVLIWLIHI